jgi:RAB6A-GEF complex partner protein 2
LAAGIPSPLSLNYTPRSSGDSHTQSIGSTETLISDYPLRDPDRPPRTARSNRGLSLLAPTERGKMTEVMMIGYGQLAGFFTLDGSLIKQQPFEHVKRKGVIGGQGGGGVVRAEKNEQGGIFSTLRWGHLGESLGGMLGGKELSSIKEMKDNARLRSIPILSTPQSVLFVDLKLEPGESVTYTYRCPLPSAIPPTHKGRAMKVYYHLTIGIQRAANAALKQQISTVDVPFRVVTGLNSEPSFRT